MTQAYGVIAEQETSDRGGHTQEDSFETAVGAIDAYLAVVSTSAGRPITYTVQTRRIERCDSRCAKPHDRDAVRGQTNGILINLTGNEKEGAELIYRIRPPTCPA